MKVSDLEGKLSSPQLSKEYQTEDSSQILKQSCDKGKISSSPPLSHTKNCDQGKNTSSPLRKDGQVEQSSPPLKHYEEKLVFEGN